MSFTITAAKVIAVRLCPNPGTTPAAILPPMFQVHLRNPGNWTPALAAAPAQQGTLPADQTSWFTFTLTSGSSASIVASKPRWPNKYSPLSLMLLGDPTVLDNEIPPLSASATAFKPMQLTFSVDRNCKVSTSDESGNSGLVLAMNPLDIGDDYWFAFLLPEGAAGDMISSFTAKVIA